MYIVSIVHGKDEGQEQLEGSLEPVAVSVGDTIKVDGDSAAMTTAMRESDDLFITLHDSLEYHFSNFFTTDNITIEFNDATMSPSDVSELFVMLLFIRHADKIDRQVEITANGKLHAIAGDRFEIPEDETSVEDFHREFNNLRIHFHHPIKGDPCELLILDFFREVPTGKDYPVVYIADREHHPKDVYIPPKGTFLVWRGEPPSNVSAGESFAFAFSLVGVNLKNHSLIVSVDGETMPDWIELKHTGGGRYMFKGVMPEDMDSIPVIEVSLGQYKDGINVVQQQFVALGSGKVEPMDRSMTAWVMEAEIRGAFTVEAIEGAALGSSMAASYAPMLVVASVSSLSAINVLGMAKLPNASFYSFSSKGFELGDVDLSKIGVGAGEADSFFGLFQGQTTGQVFHYLEGGLQEMAEHSDTEYEEDVTEDESGDTILSDSSSTETMITLPSELGGDTSGDLLAGEVRAVDDKFDVLENGFFVIRPEGVLANDINTQPGDLKITHLNGDSASVSSIVTLPSGARVLLRADGGFVYLTNNAFEFLPEGITTTDVINYTITNDLNSDNANIIMTITGQNDRPNMDSQTFTLNENDSSLPPNVVPPNSPIGFVVDTIIATDVDMPDTLTYQKFGGTGFSIFDVNPVTGVITVINPNPVTALNFEGAVNSYTLNVLVTDILGALDFATHTIKVLNVNELPVAVPQTFDIDENSSGSTTVDPNPGEVVASDQDAGANGVLTYTILGGDGETVFDINLNSGEIIVQAGADIDFETKDTYTINVRIQDNGGLFIDVPMTIKVNDLNEVPVINPQAFNIDENSIVDTVVNPPPGIAVAFDQDAGSNGELTWTIESGDGKNLFDIDASTGEISVQAGADLDFETKDTYGINVRVTDGGGLFADATMTISLNNINDAPTIAPQTFNVDENSLPAVPVLPMPGEVQADDQDLIVGDMLTYTKVVGGGGFALFNIDPMTGKISVAPGAMLDFETKDTYDFDVRVTDIDGLFADATMTIDINDINETPTIAPMQMFDVDENSDKNTVLSGNMGIVEAEDQDIPEGDELTYTIEGGDGAALFDIDEDTGELSVAKNADLDHETTESYTLDVRVTDLGGIFFDESVTVTINDLNENPDIVAQTFEIAENSVEDTAVSMPAEMDPAPVVASDQDDGANGELVYTIEGGDGSALFDINGMTGQLSVAAGVDLDFETKDTYEVDVRVTDNNGGGLFSDATMTINLTDVNEIPTIAGQTFNIDENSDPADPVLPAPGEVQADDQDLSAGDVLNFTKLAGSDGFALFNIDLLSGKFTVAPGAMLDFETKDTYSFEVRVTDIDGLFADATMTIDINDVNETPTIAPMQTFDVDENSDKDTVVNGNMGIVAADDQDIPEGDELTYTIEGGNDDGFFEIDDATGVITVADGADLDHETTDSYTLDIRVTDLGGLFFDESVTVTINDLNENPDIVAQTFEVAENSVEGAAVSMPMDMDPAAVLASDQDDGANGEFVYTIEGGDGSALFDINGMTGQLTVAAGADLDFETKDTYEVDVRVTDNNGTGLSSDATMTIDLTDANDTPVITLLQTFDVDENSDKNTVLNGNLGVVEADDQDIPEGDVLTYTIEGGNDDGFFEINGATGVITVADGADLDHETKDSYTLDIRVTDIDLLTFDAPVTVTINDLNETPEIEAQSFVIPENALEDAPVGLPMAMPPAPVLASDQDDGANGEFVYSIVGGDGEPLFDIDGMSGQITVAEFADLDFETKDTYEVEVRVTDNNGTGLSSDATMTINLTDVNEIPTIAGQTFNIDENSDPADPVLPAPGEVQADDQDLTAGDVLNFTKLAGSDGFALFNIDLLSGKITVAPGAMLDHEAKDTYSFEVRVTDMGGLFADATMTININDINDAPTIAPMQMFDVDENSDKDTVVNGNIGVVAADDQDIPEGDVLTYTIEGGNDDGFFEINGATGVITVADGADLDHETKDSYTLDIRVTDIDLLTFDAPVTVTINDINEAPEIAAQAFVIPENAPENAPVGLPMAMPPAPVIATDQDDGANGVLKYTIEGGDGAAVFDINMMTGQLTVAAGADLDFEGADKTYSVDVRVTDNNGTGLFDEATMTINLTDVNEAPTIAAQTFNVDENSDETDPSFGSVVATDQDMGDSITDYAITGGDGAALFAINSTTGALSVKEFAVLDAETTLSYTLMVEVEDENMATSEATITVDINNLFDVVPVINAQAFNIDENSVEDTVVNGNGGIVVATDGDVVDTLAYKIIGGDDAALFDIDAATGELSVAAGADLDHEPDEIREVQVEVEDLGGNKADALMTITLNDINDAPTIAAQTLNVDENSDETDPSFGTVIATDQDVGDSITDYAITGGDGAALFAINSTTGALSVKAGAVLDAEGAKTSYTLTVEVEDENMATSDAQITVDVSNLFDVVPMINAQSFDIDENSVEDTVVNGNGGIVVATDGDVVDTLSYKIIGGDDQALFDIDAATGELSVAMGADLDYEVDDSREVQVEVEDLGGNKADALMTISLNDITIAPQIFDVDENSLEDTVLNGNQGKVVADNDDVVVYTYSIVGGTGAMLFDIDVNTGELSVAAGADLDFETTSAYTVDVEVDDGAVTNQAEMTINLNDGDDVYNGTSSGDTINAGEGNDMVNGNKGSDILNGEGGNDEIDGGGGKDTIDGGPGNDTIMGGNGADIINGGADMDLVIFEGQNDTSVDGGADTDTLWMKADGFDEDLTGANIFSNFEILELEADTSAAGNKVTLDATGVSSMTDAGEELTVNGGANDELTLDGAWASGASADGYTPYTLGLVTVLVEDTISSVVII